MVALNGRPSHVKSIQVEQQLSLFWVTNLGIVLKVIGMNERIKELAREAGLEFDDDLVLESEPIYYTSQKDLEKFAELVVKECVGIVEDAVNHREPASTYVDKIKQHFGVEE